MLLRHQVPTQRHFDRRFRLQHAMSRLRTAGLLVLSPCSGLSFCTDVSVGGGINFWTVYNTGIKLAIDYAEENDTSTASTSAASSTASVIASSTVVSGGQSMYSPDPSCLDVQPF